MGVLARADRGLSARSAAGAHPRAGGMRFRPPREGRPAAGNLDWRDEDRSHQCELGCEMLDERGEAVATGQAVMVAYDYSSAKPVPVPDWARSRMEEYEGRQLSRP